MLLEILTPEKKLFSGNVQGVQLPGVDGLFEILDKHAPLVSALGIGNVKVLQKGAAAESYAIQGGFVEVIDPLERSRGIFLYIHVGKFARLYQLDYEKNIPFLIYINWIIYPGNLVYSNHLVARFISIAKKSIGRKSKSSGRYCFC